MVNNLMPSYSVHPFLTKKEVFRQAGDLTPAQVILYSKTTDAQGNITSLAGQVAYQDGAGNSLGSETHTFSPPGLGLNNLGTDYNGWMQGKELSAGFYGGSGALKKSESTTWEQRQCTVDSALCWFLWGGDPNHGAVSSVNDPNAPAHDPRAAQKSETIAGGSQSVTSTDKYFVSVT